MTGSVVRRAALCVCAVIAVAAIAAAADILGQLGVNAASAKESAMRAVGSASLDYHLVAPAMKKVSGAARAQLVEGLIGWLKAYTATPEFKASYAKMREYQKPRAPEFKGTPEEEAARTADEQSKEMAKALESMPPDLRKQLEATYKQTAETMASPQMKKLQLDGIRMERQQKTERYTKAMARWTEDYPEDSGRLVAKRLKAFVETSADVNFDATLEKRGSLMKFTDAKYEDKPSEWKLCFRAGREATAAARAAAQAWLKELGPSGTE